MKKLGDVRVSSIEVLKALAASAPRQDEMTSTRRGTTRGKKRDSRGSQKADLRALLPSESILSRSIQSSSFLEIVTTKEILERLKIGRTKLFELKRNGTLIPGRHFFQNGRVLRFVWGTDLIETIHENPAEKPETTNERYRKSETYSKRIGRKGAINLNY